MRCDFESYIHNLTVIISTMQHAIDISEKKITPTYSGERAVCDFCNKEVKSKA